MIIILQVKFTIAVEESFQWSLQIAGDSLQHDSLPLAHLPQGIDTARLARAVVEGVESLPSSMMWDLPAPSIATLTGRIKALSALPQGT